MLSGFADLHVIDFMFVQAVLLQLTREPWKTVATQDLQAVDFLRERAEFLFCLDLEELHKMGLEIK